MIGTVFSIAFFDCVWQTDIKCDRHPRILAPEDLIYKVFCTNRKT
jgi:hypothetical protein